MKIFQIKVIKISNYLMSFNLVEINHNKALINQKRRKIKNIHRILNLLYKKL